MKAKGKKGGVVPFREKGHYQGASSNSEGKQRKNSRRKAAVGLETRKRRKGDGYRTKRRRKKRTRSTFRMSEAKKQSYQPNFLQRGNGVSPQSVTGPGATEKGKKSRRKDCCKKKKTFGDDIGGEVLR